MLKALAKDPKDRFATAGELRDELRRFLEGRPIRSRPVGPAERAWRWCKRNPIVAALLALVIGLSVTLAAGSTAAWLRLRGSYEQIRLEGDRAEDNFREARRAVDDSFTRISESALLNAPGVQPLRKQLLEDALKYYQGFVRRLGDRPGVQADLAAALDRVARITAEIGSKEEALGYQIKARGIYQSLLAAESRRCPAPPRAGPVHRGGRHACAARPAGARRPWSITSRPWPSSGRSPMPTATTLQVLDDMAVSEIGARPGAQGPRPARRALAMPRAGPGDPGAIGSPPTRIAREYQHDLALDPAAISARCYNDAGRHDEASRSYRRAIAMHEALVAAHPEVAPYRFSLATTYHLLGVSQRRANRLDEALESYRKAQELHEALVAANPSVIDYRYELAGTLNNIANIQRAARQPEEALRTHRRALELRETLIVADPRVVRYQSCDRQQLQRDRDDPGRSSAGPRRRCGRSSSSATGCRRCWPTTRGTSTPDLALERPAQHGRSPGGTGPAGRGGARPSAARSSRNASILPGQQDEGRHAARWATLSRPGRSPAGAGPAGRGGGDPAGAPGTLGRRPGRALRHGLRAVAVHPDRRQGPGRTDPGAAGRAQEVRRSGDGRAAAGRGRRLP